jgi:hypoxanthine phosphoribosyltransferase
VTEALVGPPPYARAIEAVLLTEAEIAAKVRDLALRLSADYAGRETMLVGVLNGSVVFLADLLRALTIPVTVDFVGVSSYGDETVSSGECRFTKGIGQNLSDKHVIVVEDIVDSGRTLAAIVRCLEAEGALSVEICTLLDKPSRRAVELHPRYIGVEIPDKFVVGYGLDYAQHYRGLPYVAVLKPEAYDSSP